jgi:hypothetical protein
VTNLGRQWLPFALYPAAIIPLLGIHLWATSGVSPFAAVRGMAVAIILGVAIAAVGAALMRDRHRGGLAALLISMAVVAGGRAGIVPLVAVCLGLLLFERYGPVHLRVRWDWIARMASRGTVIFALAVAIEVVQMGRVGDAVTAFQREGPFHQPTTAQAPPEAPDVFVVLLDGYARADILRDRFGFTSTPLTDGLRERGFDVASKSHSNYLITNLSLSSFLNYAPLDAVPAIRPLLDHPSDPEGPPVNRATSGAAVLDAFRTIGYETVAVSSGFEQPALRGADRFIDTGQINEFEIQMLRPSILAPLAAAIDPDVFSGQQRARIEGIFESVEELAAERGQRPRFVFAHVPSPHAPWVVNADGSPRVASDLSTVYSDTPETTGLTREEIVAGYAGQVSYLDQRALATVDAILAGAERPPVILVISDHGSSLDVTVENAETRLRNLVAVYTPGHPGIYPDDATLVNLFPTLFKAYFGVELGRSPDTLFTQGPNGLFDPVPITAVGEPR